MSTIETTYNWNALRVGKGKSSITKKKTIKNLGLKLYRCRPATAKVKSSETSRDLNGYLPKGQDHFGFILLYVNKKKVFNCLLIKVNVSLQYSDVKYLI